jgi:multidrug resistance efflux pump
MRAVAFSRTMRCVHASKSRGSILIVFLIALIFGSWAIWALQARISLYEVSDTARLEVVSAGHPIESPIVGRIVANHLVVGQFVQRGQVLVELDADTQQLQLQEEKTSASALSTNIVSLNNELVSERQAQREAREAGHKAIAEAGAQLREATTAAQFAQTEAGRLGTLHKLGFIAELEFLQAKAKAEEQDAVVERTRIAIGRLEGEHDAMEHDRQTRIERLKGELTKVEAQRSTDAATMKRLEHEVDLRRIEAPINGRVGEVADLRVGSMVNTSSSLGTIIPDGEIRAVAYFPAQSALGRIRSGQAARLQLNGFPWSQYGSLAATVTTVAGEGKDEHVRVELQVSSDQTSAIPLQHGLPGTVEIEVKKVSPLILVLQFIDRSTTQ